MDSKNIDLNKLPGANISTIISNTSASVKFSYLDCPNGKIAMLTGQKFIDLSSWVQDNLEYVQKLFDENFALLFRNFSVDNQDAFTYFTKQFSLELMDYSEPSTPRSRVADKVFTSTEYPKNQTIPLHNEHSYTNNWPKRIWFYCAVAPVAQGETPIADSRLIYQNLDEYIRDEFINKGIIYVRNFNEGLDLSWQHVFQTDDKTELEAQLRRKGIAFEWKANGNLCTKQKTHVVLDHPITKEKIWFNQAHLFHISNLQPDIRAFLTEEYGIENVPRNVCFGDESAIPEFYLEEIRRVYKQQELVFKWEKSDVIMLDNMMYAHGRNPFEGDRKILVAMADPMESEIKNSFVEKEKNIGTTRKNTAKYFLKNNLTDSSAEMLKYKLAASYRMMVSEKLDEGGISGHISMRVLDRPDHFWVNPFGLLAEDVNVDNLIMVDEKGNVVEGDYPINVAGFCIHSAIHQKYPNVNCIAHTHSPWGTLFSSLNKKILPLDQNCCMFFEDHVLFSEYNGAVKDATDAEKIANAIDGNNCIILQNHGTITCGETIEGAIIRMIAMERAYRLNFLSHQIPDAQLIEPDIARDTKIWIGNEIGLAIEFNALLRKVERLYPDLLKQKPC